MKPETLKKILKKTNLNHYSGRIDFLNMEIFLLDETAEKLRSETDDLTEKKDHIKSEKVFGILDYYRLKGEINYRKMKLKIFAERRRKLKTKLNRSRRIFTHLAKNYLCNESSTK